MGEDSRPVGYVNTPISDISHSRQSLLEARQEKLKEVEVKVGDESASAVGGIPLPPASARQSTEDAGSGMEQDPPPATQDGGGTAKDGKPEPHPPQKKFRMTESIRTIVWQLVNLSNECCRLENEKK